MQAMEEKEKKSENAGESRKREPSWPGVLFELYLIMAICFGTAFLFEAKWATIFYTLLLLSAGLLGTTAGAHRLWAHGTYSANLTLRIILMLCQTLVGNASIYDWVLEHRIHHKFHGTENDPFNYKKGFAHSFWSSYIHKRPPNWNELVKQIDMTDLEEDSVVMFQKRFYWVLMIWVNLIVAMNTPAEHWGESLLVSCMLVGLFRIPIALYLSRLVNSARVVWGLEPNDRFFSDSNLVYLIQKSHWHAYHYNIPWDCLTTEFGSYNEGCTTAFIKIWAAIGWASNLKTVDTTTMRRGLERAIDTGKTVEECVREIVTEQQELHPEDQLLGMLKSNKLSPK